METRYPFQQVHGVHYLLVAAHLPRRDPVQLDCAPIWTQLVLDPICNDNVKL